MGNKKNGLKLFLFGIIELISKGRNESCTYIEDNISKGIATVLYRKYTADFDRCGFNVDRAEEVDAFYRNYAGVANGAEGKFGCEEKDGLLLIIALAVNEME